MPASFDVACSTGNYRVEIRSGLLADVLFGIGDSLVLCDERFSPQFADTKFKFLPVRAEETTKSLESIPGFITQMRQLGTTRNTHLLAMGGGIVQDIAAFCASVFMRGMPWSYLPTTLLGMADSCIGGKSSINVGEYKNLVGTFYPPTAVLIDPVFTRTLSTEQIVEGLCEAVKICFCRSPEAFDQYISYLPSPTMTETALEKVVTVSLESKRWFIQEDEFDRGPRLLLNFGHTFGHALEGASHFGVTHGTAVGFGVICAIAFGEALGRKYDDLPRVQAFKSHVTELLAAVPDLPRQLGQTTVDQCCERFLADKKHGADFFSFIIVNEGGHVERIQRPKDQASIELVKAAYQRTFKVFAT